MNSSFSQYTTKKEKTEESFDDFDDDFEEEEEKPKVAKKLSTQPKKTQVKKASKFGAKKTTSFATKSAVPKKKAGLSTQKIDDDFDDFDDWDVDVEEEEPAEDLTVEYISSF